MPASASSRREADDDELHLALGLLRDLAGVDADSLANALANSGLAPDVWRRALTLCADPGLQASLEEWLDRQAVDGACLGRRIADDLRGGSSPTEAARAILADLGQMLNLRSAELRVSAEGPIALRVAALGARGMVRRGTIYVHPSGFDPLRSRDDLRVLAHEAVHVAQGHIATAPGVPRAEAIRDAELEADALASSYALGRSLQEPTHGLPSGYEPLDLGAAQARGRSRVSRPQSAHRVSAGMQGLVLQFTRRARFLPGLGRELQVYAAVLRALLGKRYDPELPGVLAAEGELGFEPHLTGLAGANESFPRRVRLPPAHLARLMTWLEGRGLRVELSKTRRRLLQAAFFAQTAWWVLSRDQASTVCPDWVDEGLFCELQRTNVEGLEAFAAVAWRLFVPGAGRDSLADPGLEVREAADRLAEPYADALAIVDEILGDDALRRHPTVVTLRRGRGVNPEVALPLIRYIRRRRFSDRRVSELLSDTRARRQLLSHFSSFRRRTKRQREPLTADAVLRGPLGEATLPPLPSTLSSPSIKPPLNAGVEGAEPYFHMHISYPDAMTALGTRMEYRFAVTRLSTAQVEALVQRGGGVPHGSQPKDRAARLAAQLEAVEHAGARIAEDGEAVSSVVWHRLRRVYRNYTTDLARATPRGGWGARARAALEGLEAGTALGLGVGATALASAAAALAFLGTLLKGLLEHLFRPRSLKPVPLDKGPGLYVIGCVATDRLSARGAERPFRFASSVAYNAVWVKPTAQWAGELLDDQRAGARREAELLAGLRARIEELDPSERLQAEGLRLHAAWLGARRGRSKEAALQAERAYRRWQKSNPQEGLDVVAIESRLDAIDELLETQRARHQDHAGLEPVPLRAAFVGDTGESIMLELEAYLPPGRRGPDGYRCDISDLTTPDGGVASGRGASPAAALADALETLLEGTDGYGRGHVALDIPALPLVNGRTGMPRRELIRIEQSRGQQVIEVIEGLAMAAAVAAVLAAPVTGGASLALMVPVGIVGAVPSGYRLVRRAEASTLRFDLAAAQDLCQVLGAAVGVKVFAANLATATSATRTFRLIQKTSRGLVMVGIGADTTGAVLAYAELLEQLRVIREQESDPAMRRIRIIEVVAQQLLDIGLEAGGALGRHAGAMRRTMSDPSSRHGHLPRDGRLEATALTRLDAPVPVFRNATVDAPFVHVEADSNGVIESVAIHVDLELARSGLATHPVLAAAERAASLLELGRHVTARIDSARAAPPRERRALLRRALAQRDELRHLAGLATDQAASPDDFRRRREALEAELARGDGAATLDGSDPDGDRESARRPLRDESAATDADGRVAGSAEAGGTADGTDGSYSDGVISDALAQRLSIDLRDVPPHRRIWATVAGLEGPNRRDEARVRHANLRRLEAVRGSLDGTTLWYDGAGAIVHVGEAPPASLRRALVFGRLASATVRIEPTGGRVKLEGLGPNRFEEGGARSVVLDSVRAVQERGPLGRLLGHARHRLEGQAEDALWEVPRAAHLAFSFDHPDDPASLSLDDPIPGITDVHFHGDAGAPGVAAWEHPDPSVRQRFNRHFEWRDDRPRPSPEAPISLSAADLYVALRRRGWNGQTPLRLIACESDSLAADLADIAGVPVIAAPDPVIVSQFWQPHSAAGFRVFRPGLPHRLWATRLLAEAPPEVLADIRVVFSDRLQRSDPSAASVEVTIRDGHPVGLRLLVGLETTPAAVAALRGTLSRTHALLGAHKALSKRLAEVTDDPGLESLLQRLDDALDAPLATDEATAHALLKAVRRVTGADPMDSASGAENPRGERRGDRVPAGGRVMSDKRVVVGGSPHTAKIVRGQDGTRRAYLCSVCSDLLDIVQSAIRIAEQMRGEGVPLPRGALSTLTTARRSLRAALAKRPDGAAVADVAQVVVQLYARLQQALDPASFARVASCFGDLPSVLVQGATAAGSVALRVKYAAAIYGHRHGVAHQAGVELLLTNLASGELQRVATAERGMEAAVADAPRLLAEMALDHRVTDLSAWAQDAQGYGPRAATEALERQRAHQRLNALNELREGWHQARGEGGQQTSMRETPIEGTMRSSDVNSPSLRTEVKSQAARATRSVEVLGTVLSGTAKWNTAPARKPGDPRRRVVVYASLDPAITQDVTRGKGVRFVNTYDAQTGQLRTELHAGGTLRKTTTINWFDGLLRALNQSPPGNPGLLHVDEITVRVYGGSTARFSRSGATWSFTVTGAT